MRDLHPFLSLFVAAATAAGCTPPVAATAGPTPGPSAVAIARAQVAIPTARVRLDPAGALDHAISPTTAADRLGGRLFQFGPGAYRLPRPTGANGLYLVLATPELTGPGTDLELSVDGAAANPTDGDPIALRSREAAPLPELGCGAALIARPPAGGPLPPARRVLAARGAADKETFAVIRPGLPAPAGEAYDEVEVPTRRIFTGEFCHVYLDALITAPAAEAEARTLGEAFDRDLYPAVTGAFGAAPDPGVDEERRIFLVVTPQVSAEGRTGTLAYFARRDQAAPDPARPSTRRSNQRDALFIDARTLTQERRPDLYAAVAHEFQHLVHFTRQAPRLSPGTSEELWLEEALATYASHVAGYTFKTSRTMYGHVAGFFARAYNYSLTDWPGNPYGNGYGPGYMFIAYLVDRFGDEFLAECAGASEVGKANLDARLRARGSSYPEAFADWAVALVNDGMYDDPSGRFAYKTLELRGDTPFGRLDGPAAIRLGPTGAHIPRRADVAYLFHVRPDPALIEPTVRATGTFQGMAIVP